MPVNGLLQIAFYLVVLLALVKPLGWYMARVYEASPPGWIASWGRSSACSIGLLGCSRTQG